MDYSNDIIDAYIADYDEDDVGHNFNHNSQEEDEENEFLGLMGYREETIMPNDNVDIEETNTESQYYYPFDEEIEEYKDNYSTNSSGKL